jgi:uncharacterized protein YjbI with pentapeptide repeats
MWLGDRPQILLDLPGLATVDTLGDPLASLVRPDLMWVWPRRDSDPETLLGRLLAEVGPIPGEDAFRGWGWRTWLSRDWAARLLPADELPEPVRVRPQDDGMVRVDLAEDLFDEAAVLRGHASLTAASASGADDRPQPAGRLSVAEVERRAGPSANLDGVRTEGADLRSRDLVRSSWRRSVLVDCDFDDASMVAAAFDEAQLDQVSLRRCDLTGASFLGADLVSSFLEGARLASADLRGVSLVNCELAGVVAPRGNFEAALIEDTRLTGADLTDARFDRATLRRCDLRGARLDGVGLATAVLEDCVLMR